MRRAQLLRKRALRRAAAGNGGALLKGRRWAERGPARRLLPLTGSGPRARAMEARRARGKRYRIRSRHSLEWATASHSTNVRSRGSKKPTASESRSKIVQTLLLVAMNPAAEEDMRFVSVSACASTRHRSWALDFRRSEFWWLLTRCMFPCFVICFVILCAVRFKHEQQRSGVGSPPFTEAR
jgi:hypothetical protein